mgnify:CR=1 FL=1
MSIYCINKEFKTEINTIYSVIACIRVKSKKIKLDKEKKGNALGKNI